MRIKTCIGLHALASLVCAMAISACASSNYPASPTQNSAPAASRSAADTSSAVQSPNTDGEDESSAALEALWQERTASTATPNSGFSLGPGDVLRISVPMVSQLTDRTVRVSENDTIALPLLGVINVAGMTEQDLRQELASRLGRYMYNPQVEVYLQTPENRVVSVLGSIKAPGRYIVASRSDTIMTLLSRAGGTTETAGSQLLFFPAPSTRSMAPVRANIVADASGTPAHYQLTRQDATASADDPSFATDESTMLTQNKPGSPLLISIAGPERYMEMPVRPGDVLLVPAAGSVSVQGWVDKPGIFPITPGMTALGSIAAAGGALYTPSATLVRAGHGGGRQQIALNLPRIKSGQDPDVPVRGGDVIIVERSVPGALPYTLYFLASKIGLGLPLFY
ncbi:MAG: polysaccharide biosynthesis/export family protein [Deltaproteobacteria bacterium]|nr:polysaccharide biosynthesis/export family protein [Deltaproteobacteria bacterium]